VTTAGPSLSRELARIIRRQAVDAGDLARAGYFVRDWLGSYVAGWNTPVGRILIGTRGREVDPGVDGDVFLAAALSHITETDDLHRSSVTHPACVVVPVALLLGRSRGAPGDRVLAAVLAGYEAMIRVGDALGPAHYRTFHNTATAGVFGAAAAASSLLKLDEDAWVWAFGSAGTQAAGLWEFRADGAMSKHLHAGHAASAGMRAALLASCGFTGPERILEGDRGFFRALCPDPDPAAVTAEAPGWRLGETSIKPYPCCRHTHPAIDAVLELRRELAAAGVTPGEVDGVQVLAYPDALGITDDPDPGSAWEAKFSLQFCVAAALLHGAPTLETFEDRIRDPGVRGLMERVVLRPDPGLAEAYPARWGAEIILSASAPGDRRETWSSRCETPRGDPENPLAGAELDAKVLGLLGYGGMGEGEGERLLEGFRRMTVGGATVAIPWPDGGPG
jgi:2-methylcitrate dehydratase PrpD